MNIKDVSKREVMDFEEFRGRVHDDTYKPLDPKNQKDSRDRTGLNTIKREPAYDFAGYADAVFGKTSGIEVPGYNEKGNREYTIDNASPSIIAQPNSAVTESDEWTGIPRIFKINDFENEIAEDSNVGSIDNTETENIKSEDFITKLSEFDK